MSKNKTKELREVPAKNYIILLVVFLATFLLVYYLYRFYMVYSDFQKQTPILRDVLPEISNQELEHYVQESPTTIVYLCTASSDSCRSFEKSFKKLIEKKHLETQITYVNLSNTNLDEFRKKINEEYSYKEKLKNKYPAFIVFEDNKIRDILQSESNKKLTITEVDQFLKRNKIRD